MESIKSKFDDTLEYAIVAEEQHQDGTPHLHVILSLKDKLRTSLPNFFDFIGGKHGNYQTQRSPVKNMKYVVKCGVYVSHGIDVTAFLQAADAKSGMKGTLVANMIMNNNANLKECLVYDAGYSLTNKRKIEELIEYRDQEKFKRARIALVEDVELKQWQRRAIDRLLEQDDRKILWIWESEGGIGKTFLAKYLAFKHNAFICTNGKISDIAQAFKSQEIVAMDFTRDYEDKINYSVLESFKNGFIFSPKYDSQVKHFTPCKVIVFANFAPNESKLSLDRWDIVNIRRPN